MSPTKMTSKTENGDGVMIALADPIEARLTTAQRQVDALTPARSDFALSLCGIRRARSQCARLLGHLVPQDPTDGPAAKPLEGIRR